jgi:hypothetical protein
MKRLKEAESREGMRAMTVWLPDEMHHALARLRAEEHIAAGQAIREAVDSWLARKRKKGGRS